MYSTFDTTLGWSRWTAALLVMLYHLRFLLFASYEQVQHKGWLLKAFYLLTGLGHEGFVLYMLASGLTLARLHRPSRAEPAQRLRQKAIWSYALLLPALLLGAGFDVAGSRSATLQSAYAFFSQYSPDLSLTALLENLLPIQRFVVPGFGSNAMLYLLAYECWAYLAYLACMSARGARRGGVLAACIGLSASALAPEFLSYLLLWMIGAWVRQQADNPRARWPAWGGTAALLLGLGLSRLGAGPVSHWPPHWMLIGRSLLDLQLGLALAAFFLSLDRKPQPRAAWRRWPRRLSLSFPAASSVILACHFPFMMLLVAWVAHTAQVPLGGQPQTLSFLILALAALSILAYALLLCRLGRRLAQPLRMLVEHVSTRF
ncbi:hypothetical protein [Massilia sp. TS11]|uniref:hypothetical protein n=1 Tax=Massilia sp. TS11 TaxID=2908003 RepID=UPI001ED9E5E2|nr:hypothetical protein [Massilia sp. TS11]MCG2584340.1 hypothetical protein [Massilia sp. TS11]